jgi:hypothetical protein
MALIHRETKRAYYTPTKCGTVSSIAMLEKQGWEFTAGDRHTMDPSLGETRYMQVRHPLDRWASMYWAIERWTNSGSHPFLWQWAGRPVEFADEWIARMQHKPWPIYTWSLTQNFFACEASHYFKMEELDTVFAPFFGCPVVKHLNKTKGRVTWQETLDLLREDQVQIIREWASDDLKNFEYTCER